MKMNPKNIKRFFSNWTEKLSQTCLAYQWRNIRYNNVYV